MSDSRAEFEALVSGEPYCEDVARFPNDAKKTAWPDAYISLKVALAWDVWQARDAEIAKLQQQYDECLRSHQRQNGVVAEYEDENEKLRSWLRGTIKTYARSCPCCSSLWWADGVCDDDCELRKVLEDE